LLTNLIILLLLDYYCRTMIVNLNNILLKLDYYCRTMIVNLNNILLKLDYYDVTIVNKFNYFITVKLLWQNYD
jgi:hypothetical protein